MKKFINVSRWIKVQLTVQRGTDFAPLCSRKDLRRYIYYML